MFTVRVLSYYNMLEGYDKMVTAQVTDMLICQSEGGMPCSALKLNAEA